MNTLNLAKTSTLLTATERAKMVIALQMKAMKEVNAKNLGEDDLFAQDSPVSFAKLEIEQLIAGCPNSQASQYNFLIDIKKLVWDQLVEKIRQGILYLQIIEGSMAVTKYSLTLAPYVHFLIEDLERIPIVITKEKYDEGVERAREVERTQIIKMDGRNSLPEQEAYYRLISDGKIADGELDSYLDYIADFGRSENDLIEEKVKEIKEGVGNYQKEKERLEGGEPHSNYYAKYFGLTDDEIKEMILVEYKGSFSVPTQAEVDEWNVAVNKEKDRILKAANEGKLKTKDGGIEAGSYYDWQERYQKFAGEKSAEKRGWNPLAEDCLEIGYSDGKVMSSLEAIDNHDWRGIVIATLHNQHQIGIYSPESIEARVQGVIESLKLLLPFEIVDDNKNHEMVIKMKSEEKKEDLKDFVKMAKEKIVDILNNQALIAAIENEYFGGMELVGRTEDVPDFSFDKINSYIKEFVTNHNKKIKKIMTSFNQLGGGYWNYYFECMDEYLVPEDLMPDQSWVNQKLNNLEREVSRS